ncbi:MAG: hypothetical protein M1165_02045 [Candidatus Pacearchaeota archaeon]|nr:hypothetical protein [Candidatus Pacearchaeota archaeon]
MAETIVTETKNSQVIGNELIEVDFAYSFQDSIISSSVLEFQKEELKNKILGADGNQLLVVKSTINSPKTITSVEFYNEEFLMNNL